MLALRQEGTAPPLFCLAPASGLGWQFAALKRYLPEDIPLYALQAPTFSGSPQPATLDALAEHYADLVTDTAPTGPLRLLGWSFGGSVAFMLARVLRGRGRDVGFVGMLDARVDVAEDIATSTEAGFDTERVLAELLREMGFTAPGRIGVRDAVALVRASDDAIAVLDDRQIEVVIENYLASERLTASADYGRYDGDVWFVDATRLEMNLRGVASQGWRTHVGGALRVVSVGCRHSELMDTEALDTFAPLLVEELRRWPDPRPADR